MSETVVSNKLSNNAVVATLTGVILITVLSILGYYITRPYIQYEEGQYYKIGSVAVTSLRLENKGYRDAEEVIVQVAFTEPITDITSGDGVSPLTVTGGGKGFKYVVGTLARVVPSQSTYVYFGIDNSNGGVGDGIQSFVKQVTFKGGKGSIQPPLWTRLPYIIIAAIAGQLLVFLILEYFKKSVELQAIHSSLQQMTEESKQRLNEWEETFEKDKKEYAERMAEEKRKWAVEDEQWRKKLGDGS